MATVKSKTSGVPEQTQALVKRIATEVEKICISLNALQITTPAHFDDAQALAKRVKERLHVVEKEEKEITKPLSIAMKAVKALFKPVKDTLQNGELILKNKIADYWDEQEAIRLKEQAKIDKATEAKVLKLEAKGKVTEALAVQAAAVTIEKVSTTDSIGFRKILDHEKIEAEVQAHQDKTTIPGIIVWAEWKWNVQSREDIPAEYYKTSVAIGG